MKRRKTVTRRQCTTLAMVAGGERKHSTIISEGRRLHWVGIGWVDEGPATADDKKKFPELSPS